MKTHQPAQIRAPFIRDTQIDIRLHRVLSRDWVVFGEVGLSGEIRPVPSGQERLSEAAKHGFKRAVVPKGNVPKQPIKGLEVIGVSRLSEALDALL